MNMTLLTCTTSSCRYLDLASTKIWLGKMKVLKVIQGHYYSLFSLLVQYLVLVPGSNIIMMSLFESK